MLPMNREDYFLDIREHKRVRVPVPFSCSFSRLGIARWFNGNAHGLGVVYDVSIKGARVSSEATIVPGDEISVVLKLPLQASPLAVERATVRWAKNQTFGLEFTSLPATSAARLRKFFALHLAAAA